MFCILYVDIEEEWIENLLNDASHCYEIVNMVKITHNWLIRQLLVTHFLIYAPMLVLHFSALRFV